MFITRKKYEKMEFEIKALQQQLAEARDLKGLLGKIIERTGIPMPPQQNGLTMKNVILNANGNWPSWGGVNLGDHVLVYVDDLFGGKVVKQEAVKAIRIDKEGNVTQGLTKLSPDKGYSYRLKRD